MRLICPNCGAQYAVAEDAIPSGGRDVQCSNCAHTWFETPGASASDTPTEPRKPTPPPTPTPNADRFSGSINDAFKDVEDEENLSPAPQPPKNRKPVDPSVADILRQEAAIETTRRKTETASTMESQSDLGLSDPAPVRPKAPEQPAPATVAAVVSAPIASIATTAQAPRRELLPDIEEINSSLRSDAERIEDGTAGPALANTIKAYVDAIDIGRIWLDDNVQSMLSYIAAE
jgi:predicted Zn finger-like uncharacterized protein